MPVSCANPLGITIKLLATDLDVLRLVVVARHGARRWPHRRVQSDWGAREERWILSACRLLRGMRSRMVHEWCISACRQGVLHPQKSRSHGVETMGIEPTTPCLQIRTTWTVANDCERLRLIRVGWRTVADISERQRMFDKCSIVPPRSELLLLRSALLGSRHGSVQGSPVRIRPGLPPSAVSSEGLQYEEHPPRRAIVSWF
jgi:hypothetical protein